MTDTTPEIYPQYCFHLSPTINKWVLLHATDVFALGTVPGFEGQNVYFYHNHPLKWIRVCGIVVAVDDYGERRIYTLDDSSGAAIECVVTVRKPVLPVQGAAPSSRLQAAGTESAQDAPSVPSIPYIHKPREKRKPVVTVPAPSNLLPDEEVDVGHILDVKGTVRVYWERQINVERMTILRSTEQEVAVWEKRNRFWDETLRKPWILDPKIVRRCRREAEMDARGAGERDKGMEREREEKRSRRRELRGKADLGQPLGGVDGGGDVGEGGGSGTEPEKKQGLSDLGEAQNQSKFQNVGTANVSEEREGKPSAVTVSEEAILTERLPERKEHKKRPITDLRNSGNAVESQETTRSQRPLERKGRRIRPIADLGNCGHPRSTETKFTNHELVVVSYPGSEDHSSRLRENDESCTLRKKNKRHAADFGSTPAPVPHSGAKTSILTTDNATGMAQHMIDHASPGERKKLRGMADLGVSAVTKPRTGHPKAHHRPTDEANCVPASLSRTEIGTGSENVYPALATHYSVGGGKEMKRLRGRADLGGSSSGAREADNTQTTKQRIQSSATGGLDGRSSVPPPRRDRRWAADLGHGKATLEPGKGLETRRRATALADLGQAQAMEGTEERGRDGNLAMTARKPKRWKADLGRGY